MDAKNRKIAILGAGSWGTALGIQLAKRHQVALWGHLSEDIQSLRQAGENVLYLPGIPLPQKLQPTDNMAQAVASADEILLAVPSHAFAATCAKLVDVRQGLHHLSWATKGFDPTTVQLLSDVAKQYFPAADFAMLSGPTFAREVALGMPTAIAIAATSATYAQRLSQYLHADGLRTYTTMDLVGVQVGAACKNIIAIASGISDGLGFGANARAALITRGLAEITRFGLTLGGKPETFMGLTGLGDLVLTCTDNQSRNRRMGLALADGMSVVEAKLSIGQEVEGVSATREVWLQAQQLDVDMPITQQAYQVLYQSMPPRDAVAELLARDIKPE